MRTIPSDKHALRLYDVAALSKTMYECRNPGVAEIAVVIPLYNYAHTILGVLESVVKQDCRKLSVVVIDDGSSDDGAAKAIQFLKAHPKRFVHAQVVRHKRNQGLSMTRNSGVALTSEPFLFMLDADNKLRPPALSRLLEAIHLSGAEFAYSQLRYIGESNGFGTADIWLPEQLTHGNYIDAMALLRRTALLAIGGYRGLADDHGWEDYDLWCSFADHGFSGVFLPEALSEYTVHSASMLRARTNNYADDLIAEMTLRHPMLFAKRR